MRALREEEDAARRTVTVGLDLTEETRSGLIDGVLRLVLSHPLRTMAEATVEAMVTAIERDRRDRPAQLLLPFDIHTPESV